MTEVALFENEALHNEYFAVAGMVNSCDGDAAAILSGALGKGNNMRSKNVNGGKKKIMLALQGGGAHTAYVWGVMDRLLERDDIDIVAVSGTSGGAMIAAAVACGLSMQHDAAGKPLDDAGRRLQAKSLLRKFWEDVAAIGDSYWNPYRFAPNSFYRSWNIDGMPIPIILNTMSLVSSPYQSFTGARQNPVAAAISNTIDMEVLRTSEIGPALYICATNVRTNQPKVFLKHEIRIEHLLASACLPVVDRAVKIDGEYYWDGGYVADPGLSPLVEQHSTVTGDLVIVGVNPIVIKHNAVPPDTAWEIIDRINEITFNATLISEIKRIQSTNELLEQVPANAPAKREGGKLFGKKEIFIHYIPPHEAMADLGVASKNNTALVFLEHLKTLGRDVAEQWETGKIRGGGASRLGISSDTNIDELFITSQCWDAQEIPSQMAYVAEGARASSVAIAQK